MCVAVDVVTEVDCVGVSVVVVDDGFAERHGKVGALAVEGTREVVCEAQIVSFSLRMFV